MTVTLPTKPKTPDTDIGKYLVLAYGREKVGKTTLFSQWPEALFLSTEPGTKGLPIYEIQVDGWATIRDAVALLEREKHRFKTVVIDTVDRAYDMCLDYVCEERGIEYPGEDSSGEADYGRSWRAVKQEFMDIIHRIVRTGRGVCFTSHAVEQEIKTRTGEKYTRIFPSMSAQARKVIEALVDIFFYAEYMRDKNGNTMRVLICRGDDTVWAGHRRCAGAFPALLPLLEEGGYEVFRQGFNGEHPGVDLSTVVPSRQTAKTAADHVRRLRSQGAVSLPTKSAVGAPPIQRAARRRE